jgi:NPCBM/NEW2 domain
VPLTPDQDHRMNIEIRSRGVLRYSYFTTTTVVVGILSMVVSWVFILNTKGPSGDNPGGPPTANPTTSKPAPAGARLGDLGPVEPNPSIEEVSTSQLSGKPLAGSIVFSLNNERHLTSAYLLAGSFTRLHGILGLDDRSNSAAAVSFVLVADGRTILTYNARVGQQRNFSLDVAGVRQLEIRVSSTGSDVCCAEAVVAGPWLVGA